MSIQMRAEDRRQYTPEYVDVLEKSCRKWRKSRWILLVCMAWLIFNAIWIMIISTTKFTWILGMISLIGFSVITIWIILAWNKPPRKYEKAKVIREILETEEAEMKAKNAQGN